MTIAEVARRTGLSSDVIRIWERRYGAVTPLREHGIRHYTEEDVNRLRLLALGAARGQRISTLAGLSNARLTHMLGKEGHANGFAAEDSEIRRRLRGNALDLAADRRAADAAAVGTAEAMHADLFVTDRPYATGRQRHADGVAVCTPAEALPIVGLYLRSQGEFDVYGSAPGRCPLSMNRGLYYDVGSRDMLPSGWRWGTACNQHEVDGLGAIAMAVFDRFARTPRVRDDLLRAVNRTQNNDIAEDVLLALDTCLLMRMGAFDSTAPVVHAVLNLNGSSYGAGWQRDRW